MFAGSCGFFSMSGPPAHDKKFAVCFWAFAVCQQHTANSLNPVVNNRETKWSLHHVKIDGS
jgi:hypothetical protein